MRFNHRVACVTGAGNGIGRAIALRLAAEGASVAVCDLDGEAAQSAAAEIVANGGTAIALECDVTSRGSVDAAFAQLIDRYGRLDVLVTSAGGDWDEPAFEDTPDDLWNEKLDLNLSGVMRSVRAALPSLIAAGPGSNVVVISSINADFAFGGYGYSAAKAGLEMVVKNLAVRYGRQGLRFNIVSPGTVRTRIWDGREEDLKRIVRMYPLGRIGEPADIAAAAAFLASTDASWITGINLPVEGGMTAGPFSTFAGIED